VSARRVCETCGARASWRYPGDDPENGAAEMTCSAGCPTASDLEYAAYLDHASACTLGDECERCRESGPELSPAEQAAADADEARWKAMTPAEQQAVIASMERACSECPR
jgi:hypothetical protein